jgi:phosphodiesterase/alkaline phosphatase D-like protein
MNRFFITLALISLLPAACSPAATAAPQPSPMPMVSEPAIVPSEPLPSEQNPPAVGSLSDATPAAAATSTGSAQVAGEAPTVTATTAGSPQGAVQPTATRKTKGKNPLPVPTSTNPDFIATEILGRPTDTSITINIVPAIPMEIYYEYGTTAGTYTSQSSPQMAAAGVPLETLLSGLQPDTRYYYRLSYNGNAGIERSFVTGRDPGNTFTFDLQSDSHPERFEKQFDPELYTRTLLGAAADRPDFYMTLGDDFSVDALKTVNPETITALYIHQRQWLGLVGAPVFLVNGNHEQAALANLDGTPDNVAVWAQTARNAYFPQPAPDAFYAGDAETVEHIGLLRDYYAFTWGDALFVVIDPYWHSPQAVDNPFGMDRDRKEERDLWNATLGDAQYRWFRQVLENSGAKYKFVFSHHVLGTGRGGIEPAGTFEWGDAANLSSHRDWDKTIHQVMVDSHVTIFFQGHDHIFARQELDGVTYQSLPEPANPFYTFENEGAYKSGDKFPNSGHVRVTVSPNGVTVDYIRSYLDRPDEPAFSYSIQ